MADEKESFASKLLFAVLNQLVFAGLLLAFGYWLNLRLENHKQALVSESERVKTLLALNDPIMKRRHAAYLDLQKVARSAVGELDVYFGATTELDKQSAEFSRLRNELGVGSGGTGGMTWSSHGDAISAIEAVVKMLAQYDDALSQDVKKSGQHFVKVIFDDVRDYAKSKAKEGIASAAVQRLHAAFNRLNERIEATMGLPELPLK